MEVYLHTEAMDGFGQHTNPFSSNKRTFEETGSIKGLLLMLCKEAL
jgi:hypothetical protein